MNINVNIEELIRSLNKLNTYKNSETTNFSKVIDLLNNINVQYNGPLNNDIKDINALIYKNFKTIGQNHETDLNYISMNITNYKSALSKSLSEFEKIGDNK